MFSTFLALFCIIAMGYAAYRLVNMVMPSELEIDKKMFILFALVTAIAFSANSFFLFFTAVTIAILLLSARDPIGKISTFALLMPLMISIKVQLGFAGIPLILFTWSVFLILVLLVPLLPSAMRAKPLLHFPLDKWVIGFAVLTAVLGFRDVTVTAGLRNALLILFATIVPYYVLSRHILTLADLRRVLVPLLMAAVAVGLINIFESARHWHLYTEISRALVDDYELLYEHRMGLLRAYGPMDKPSASAFLLATGVGVLWMLSTVSTSKRMLWVLLGIMALGLFGTFSRGSWVAAVVIALGYILTQVGMAGRIKLLFLGLTVSVAILTLTPYGELFLSVLPFYGTDEQSADTVDFRQDLLTQGLVVLGDNPFFGSTTWYDHPAFDPVKRPDGFLDVVNHYLLVGLQFGYTGVILFVGAFLSAMLALRRTIVGPGRKDAIIRTHCHALIFTFLGLMISISVTSAISRVGLILWCLLAFSAAVCSMFTKAPERRIYADYQRSSNQPS